MSNIDKLRADLLGLAGECNAKNAECKEKHDALKNYVMNVIEKNVDTSVVKVHCSATVAQLEVASHMISLYFDKQHDFNGYSRRLKLDFACFGSFGKSDAAAVKYCEVLGHVAGIMDALEDQLLNSDEAKRLWNEFDDAQREAWRANSKHSCVENEIAEYEEALEKDIILSKLLPGRQVMVSKPTAYRPAQYKTIESVTKKNIIFKEDYGRRTKKDDFAANVMRGEWMI